MSEQHHPHDFKSIPPEKVESLRKRDRTIGKGEVNGNEWTHKRAFNPDAPRYPRCGTHLWSAFALLAVETGGYNDIEAVDPYTGRVVWTRLPEDKDLNVYDQLRHLIDAMEAAEFYAASDTETLECGCPRVVVQDEGHQEGCSVKAAQPASS